MARYSNIAFGGGMASCNINGRNISVINGDIYVDGVHYVPASSEEAGKDKPFTPGKMVEHKFDVPSDFTAIASKGFMDVIFRQSDKDEDFEVRGRIPENLIDRMDVRVDGDTLYITLKNGVYDMTYTGETPTIYVTNKILKDVTSAGSGDFTISGDLKVAEGGFAVRNSGSGDFSSGKLKAAKSSVSLSTSGSGDIDIEGVEAHVFMVHISGSADVDCGEVTTKISAIDIKGSGDVKISGTTDSVEFAIAGSGDIDAGGFKAKTGKASVAGSGDIRCNVEHLSDRVRGSGDIRNRY